MMRESDFIDWICAQNECDPAVVPVGPGDDCAIVNIGDESMCVSVDQLLDGVHFRLEELGAHAVGRKAMARALSDIAAMAQIPIAAVASVAMPKGFSQSDAQEMYAGRRSVSDEFACPMVGGDTGAWSQKLAISVTVFGKPDGIAPVLRSGAKVGDAICVTGSFGGAWQTTRHVTFTPRIREARLLARRCDLHAMIDVSDGLAIDLSRICKASGVGASINAASIPVAPNAEGKRTNITPLQAAITDGEDYELLFTLPPEQAKQLLQDQPFDAAVSCIGHITQNQPANNLTITSDDGTINPLAAEGWDHQT